MTLSRAELEALDALTRELPRLAKSLEGINKTLAEAVKSLDAIAEMVDKNG